MQREEMIEADSFRSAKEYAQANGPGLIGSALLHGLGLLLILFLLAKAAPQPQQAAAPFLPVDIVQLGDETAAPSVLQKLAAPQQRQARIPVPQSASPQPPLGVSRKGKIPPVDEVEAKLRGLAKLREPVAPLRTLNNAEIADTDTTSANAVSGDAAYGLRDFIRAQVERRWNLNLDSLGKRNFTILIHLEMTRKGAVTLAEIVDKTRFKTDAVYRDIAISARNAVLLSSPFALPAGRYRDSMDMTLNLNPRDALR